MPSLKSILEALLIVSENGLTRGELVKALGDDFSAEELEASIDLLRKDCLSDDRAYNVIELAGRLRIATKPVYTEWIDRLYENNPPRLTSPALETLAVLAYKQPATRAEIEAVRGVNSGGVLKTLLEKELIRVKGRKDVIGKPLLYGTTEKFLELFGLNSLDDLPRLREFQEDDLEFAEHKERQIVQNDVPQETVEEDGLDNPDLN